MALAFTLATALAAQRSVAEAAEQRLGDPTLADDARIALMLQRARALLAYDLPRARVAARRAAAAAKRLGRASETAIALATAAAATCELESTARGRRVMEQARAELPADASVATRAIVLLIESTICFVDHDLGNAALNLERATDLATDAGADAVLGDCLLSLHDQLRATEVGLEPNAILRTAARLFAAAQNVRGQLRTRLRQADAWQWQGRDADAAAARHDVLRAAEELGDRQAILDCLARRFEAALAVGDTDRALAVAERRVDVARALGSPARLARALNAVASTHLLVDDPDGAEPALEEAMALAERLARPELERLVLRSFIEFDRQRELDAGLMHHANRLAELEPPRRDADRDAARRTLSRLRDARTATRNDRIAQLIDDAVAASTAATKNETNRTIRDLLGLATVTAVGLAVAAYRFGRRRGERRERPAEAVERSADPGSSRADGPARAAATGVAATNPLSASGGQAGGDTGRERLQGVRALAASWARQFGNTLAAVRTQVDLLLDEIPAGDPHRQRLERIRTTTEESAELCTRMFEYSNVRDHDSGSIEHEVDLRDVVTAAHEELLTSIDQTVAVRIELPPRPIRATVDTGAIRRLLVEVARLVRGGPTGVRRIVIELAEVATLPGTGPGATWFGTPRRAPSYAVLQITDDGGGSSEASLPRIFDPATGVDASRADPGLTAARTIATGFGGAFRFVADGRTKSTFAIYLPQDRAAEPPVAVPRPAIARRSGPILVVDDQDWLLAFTRLSLTQRGYQVIEASRGSEALRGSEEAEPKPVLAVIDMTLPDQDGGQLTSRLREQLPDLKVVIMSGHDEDTIRAGLGTVEVDAILPKPFAGAELVELVDSLLARAGDATEPRPDAAPRPANPAPGSPGRARE